MEFRLCVYLCDATTSLAFIPTVVPVLSYSLSSHSPSPLLHERFFPSPHHLEFFAAPLPPCFFCSWGSVHCFLIVFATVAYAQLHYSELTHSLDRVTSDTPIPLSSALLIFYYSARSRCRDICEEGALKQVRI